MNTIRNELQELADLLKRRRAAQRRPVKPMEAPAPAASEGRSATGSYGMRCALCGGPADRFTCSGCDAMYAELGL